MEPVEIIRIEAENEPYKVWDTFVDICTGSPEKLTEAQKMGHYALRYEAEILSGGHYQYFDAEASDSESFRALVQSTFEALKEMCADEHGSILKRAADTFAYDMINAGNSREAGERDSLETYDEEYHNCFPDLRFYISAFLETNLDEFVRIVEN